VVVSLFTQVPMVDGIDVNGSGEHVEPVAKLKSRVRRDAFVEGRLLVVAELGRQLL
jgi:hypothetical protein